MPSSVSLSRSYCATPPCGPSGMLTTTSLRRMSCLSLGTPRIIQLPRYERSWYVVSVAGKKQDVRKIVEHRLNYPRYRLWRLHNETFHSSEIKDYILTNPGARLPSIMKNQNNKKNVVLT